MHRVRFCEPYAPPRADPEPAQRIVIWRDIQARKRGRHRHHRAGSGVSYQGIALCRHGLCARAAGSLNTGDLVKKLRAVRRQHETAEWLAQHSPPHCKAHASPCIGNGAPCYWRATPGETLGLHDQASRGKSQWTRACHSGKSIRFSPPSTMNAHGVYLAAGYRGQWAGSRG